VLRAVLADRALVEIDPRCPAQRLTTRGTTCATYGFSDPHFACELQERPSNLRANAAAMLSSCGLPLAVISSWTAGL
jgi:hypothetical protein